jgi:hypothetical protein
MSATMTMQELGDLIKHILTNHGPMTERRGVRWVKYIDPHIDCRDGRCFAIKLRGYGWEQTFHTQNECRDLPESLDQRVRAFLDKATTGGQP